MSNLSLVIPEVDYLFVAVHQTVPTSHLHFVHSSFCQCALSACLTPSTSQPEGVRRRRTGSSSAPLEPSQPESQQEENTARFISGIFSH
ncbi:hypothetical protein PMAYCL1PPCAC_14775, partial [Pristionchus mayeri]